MTNFSVSAPSVYSDMVSNCSRRLSASCPRSHLKWPLLFSLPPRTTPSLCPVSLSLASVSLFSPLFLYFLFLLLIVFFFFGEPEKGRWWSWLWPLVWPSKMTLPISLTCRKQRRQHRQPIRSPLLRRGTGSCVRAPVVCERMECKWKGCEWYDIEEKNEMISELGRGEFCFVVFCRESQHLSALSQRAAPEIAPELHTLLQK